MTRAKLIRSLDDILDAAKRLATRRKVVLAPAEQDEGLRSLAEALRRGIVAPVLVGDRNRIVKLARSLRVPLGKMELVDEPDPLRAVQAAVGLCRRGEADILMKGAISTDQVLRAVLDRENGLASGKLLTHVTVFESPDRKRLMFMSDPAVNINPDAGRKIEIIQNAVAAARKLGIARPKIALLAATEKINPKDMPATADAAIITKMYETGQLTGADAAGPFGLDVAVSSFAAECKGISGPVAGKADILICPEINSANIFYKTLVYFAGREMAGVVLGAKAPMVVTSRSDSAATKLYTIALAAVLGGGE